MVRKSEARVKLERYRRKAWMQEWRQALEKQTIGFKEWLRAGFEALG